MKGGGAMPPSPRQRTTLAKAALLPLFCGLRWCAQSRAPARCWQLARGKARNFWRARDKVKADPGRPRRPPSCVRRPRRSSKRWRQRPRCARQRRCLGGFFHFFEMVRPLGGEWQSPAAAATRRREAGPSRRKRRSRLATAPALRAPTALPWRLLQGRRDGPASRRRVAAAS